MNKRYWYLGNLEINYGNRRRFMVKLSDNLPHSVSNPELLYLYQHGTYVPYDIKQWERAVNKIFFSLDKSYNFDKYKGSKVFIPFEVITKYLKGKENSEHLNFCAGYKVENLGVFCGYIKSVTKKNRMQLLTLEDSEVETILTINENDIKKIDHLCRKIECSITLV